MDATRTIDHALYPRRALTDATHAYREYCDIKVTPFTSQKSRLHIVVKEAHVGSSREIILEFLNYALGRSIQLQLESD